MQPSVELSYLTRTVKNRVYAYTRLPDGRTKGLGRADNPKSLPEQERIAAILDEASAANATAFT